MYDFLSKRGLTISLILALLLTLITILIFWNVEGELVKENPEAIEAANFGMYAAYILGGACAVLALVLPTVNMIMTNPKKLIIPGGAIGFILLLFFIAKGTAGDKFDDRLSQESAVKVIRDSGKTEEAFLEEMIKAKKDSVKEAVLASSEVNGMNDDEARSYAYIKSSMFVSEMYSNTELMEAMGKQANLNFEEYIKGIFKSSGGGLILSYILLILAVVAVIFSSVFKLIA